MVLVDATTPANKPPNIAVTLQTIALIVKANFMAEGSFCTNNGTMAVVMG